ncbi:MAG: MTH1187 family thiamine-binding protein [Candidatus Latescibacteria bacterium]|nr:MTH1187 family thiamine-binding protein [Candidatus Latescibacterota bacterium]
MGKIIAEVKVVPLGTGDTSLSGFVAGVQKVLEKEENLKTRLTPMSTIIEGELDAVLDAVRKMHEVPFRNGAMRVSTQISIDDRRDRQASMDRKLESVRSKMRD